MKKNLSILILFAFLASCSASVITSDNPCADKKYLKKMVCKVKTR